MTTTPDPELNPDEAVSIVEQGLTSGPSADDYDAARLDHEDDMHPQDDPPDPDAAISVLIDLIEDLREGLRGGRSDVDDLDLRAGAIRAALIRWRDQP